MFRITFKTIFLNNSQPGCSTNARFLLLTSSSGDKWTFGTRRRHTKRSRRITHRWVTSLQFLNEMKENEKKNQQKEEELKVRVKVVKVIIKIKAMPMVNVVTHLRMILGGKLGDNVANVNCVTNKESKCCLIALDPKIFLCTKCKLWRTNTAQLH